MRTLLCHVALLILFVFPGLHLAHGAEPTTSAAQNTPALPAHRVASKELPEGSATQGVVLTDTFFYGSDNRDGAGVIHRFDTQWDFVDSHEYRLAGVDHIGAFSYYAGFLWAGFLNSKGPKKSIVVKIDARDLAIVAQYDITNDVTWIDPVCFDGTYVWVGDLSDMGIHRYRVEGEALVRTGVLRYPKSLHFSQGIQVRGNKLYSMHTFGDWDGLMEFDLSDIDLNRRQTPVRSWTVPETRMHLEGFDFLPGKSNRIWHAQGKLVNCFDLEALRD